MTGARDLAGWVYVLAGTAGVLVMAGAALTWGAADAAGALVGGTVMLANFAGLHWGATRLAGAGDSGPPRPRARVLWIGASGARLGLVGVVVASALAGGVGVRGLALSLLALPTAVVVAGLRDAGAGRAV